MKKYWTVFQITLQNIFEYRWNFFLGQLRQIILLLTLYFLWTTVFAKQSQLFGFNLMQIITYIFLVQILRGIVLDSRTDNMAGEIAGEGKFFSYLMRPIGYFKYWLSIDLAYKAINIIFIIVELFLVAKVLNISLFIQTNPASILFFMVSICVAALMYFLLMSWISLIAFWTTQVWGARFALSLLIEFTSGAFFPLDILPNTFRQILNLTPFPYLVYFPAKIYLGQLSGLEIALGFATLLFYFILIYFLVKASWTAGLKVYQAFGG